MKDLLLRRHLTQPWNTLLAVDAGLLKITHELSKRGTCRGVDHRRGLEVFRYEQFVYNVLVYGLWNLIAGSIVLFDKKKAFLRLREVSYIEDCEGIGQQFLS